MKLETFLSAAQAPRHWLLGLLLLLAAPALAQETSETKSYYVPAVNGVKLALDVHLPKNYSNGKLPVLFEFTRYWRSSEDPATGKPRPALNKRDRFFLAHDYILVKVDVRGTGASFGTRPGEYTPVEVEDARYVVDWVTAQSWSNGVVGAYGTSYSGTTAELLCATKHKAVKAVIPGWSDFDIYESPTRPYGMLATGFIGTWSEFVAALDSNSAEKMKAHVRRVGDSKPDDAVAEHRGNPNVLESAIRAKYKDSRFGSYTYWQCSPISWRKEISESKVPMLVLTSWMDAGTAAGKLHRFQQFSNPQKVVLMATGHGGISNASPFTVSDKMLPPQPSVDEQLQLQLDFFDQYLKGQEKGVAAWPAIRYYNMGEEAFRETNVWPLAGERRVKYYFGAAGTLQTSAPDAKEGADRYRVDFSASTGTNNRWSTQMGKPVLRLDNRNAADSLLLTYTSAPLTGDLQLTGTPSVSITLSTTLPEGALFVYLEDVDENGRSRYLTEGGLLLEHRKLSKRKNANGLPEHSFNEADARPMPVNRPEQIALKLWPVSVLVKKGHSIRVAIAGADKDTFDRVPKEGTPTYGIFRNKVRNSFIELPVVP